MKKKYIRIILLAYLAGYIAVAVSYALNDEGYNSFIELNLMYFFMASVSIYTIAAVNRINAREPIYYYILFFVIAYLLSTFLINTQPLPHSRRVFDYTLEGITSLLHLCSLSITVICFTYLIIRKVLIRKKHQLRELKTKTELECFFGANSVAMLHMMLLYLVVKFIFLYFGYIGSVTRITADDPILVSVLRPFLTIDLMFIVMLTILRGLKKINLYTFVMFLFFFMTLAITVGDRRNLLSYFIVIYVVNNMYAYGLLKASFANVGLLLLGGVMLLVGTAVGSILGNVNDNNTNYLEILMAAFNNKEIFSMEIIEVLYYNTISTFNSLYLIDTAYKLYVDGYTYGVQPIIVYFQNLIPFASRIAPSSILTGADLQMPLFLNAITNANGRPYLTLPQLAESILSGGILAVIIYGVLYGALLIIFFRVSFINKYFLLWYLTYFPNLTYGLSSSILTSGIVPVKMLILISSIYVLRKLISVHKKYPNHTLTMNSRKFN